MRGAAQGYTAGRLNRGLGGRQSNGLCLSTIHHRASDANLLGIDPDGQIHIAEAVLSQHDGPTLEQAIKGYHGQRIRPPQHTEDQPNRDYLAERFGEFIGAG